MPEDQELVQEEYHNGWQRMQNAWRTGQQLWIRTTDNSGYIINYSFDPGRVSRYVYGDPTTTITPLPRNIRLIYKRILRYTNTSYFKEFTLEEVRNMNLDELDYTYAVYEFKNRWLDFEEDSPRRPAAIPSPPLALPEYYEENWEGLLNKWRDGSKIWI
ncbi:MAG: hypothetical protein ACKPKO_30025, partial [Candidatus Fonsibacter sp.]